MEMRDEKLYRQWKGSLFDITFWDINLQNVQQIVARNEWLEFKLSLNVQKFFGNSLIPIEYTTYVDFLVTGRIALEPTVVKTRDLNLVSCATYVADCNGRTRYPVETYDDLLPQEQRHLRRTAFKWLALRFNPKV